MTYIDFTLCIACSLALGFCIGLDGSSPGIKRASASTCSSAWG